MNKSLIIFTRYPEPGKAKTRLIPALGAEGAAMLQRQMTESTMQKVKKLTTWFPVSIEVHFAGNHQQQMQDWLGNGFVYRQQPEGDLGFRMAQAFQLAFGNGIESAVLIGTDCPGLDALLMSQAFQALEQHDLVLGPATDGGYYLIGLRWLIPELFTDINWGTSEVLQQTVEIAAQLGLVIAYLSPLADIDRPEDLEILNRECDL